MIPPRRWRRAGLAGLVLFVLLPVLPGTAAEETTRDGIFGLLEAGRLDEAEAALELALENSGADRERALAHDLLGVISSRRGDPEAAERRFRQALELAPDLFDAQQHLARLYVLQNREGEALERLRAAAALGELDRDLGLKLGVLEMAKGDSTAGAAQLRRLADRHGSVQALLYLARFEQGRGQGKLALQALGRALELAPNSEEVMRSYASLAMELKLPGEALKVLDALVRMHPRDFDYAYLTGVARLHAGDPRGAVEALEQARRLGPGQALPLVALGLALNRQKSYAEARKVLVEGLRLAPDNVEALAALAESQEGLQLLEDAEKNALRALDQQPDHAIANLVLGSVRVKQQRYEEARDALLRAIEADPGSPKAHYQLSLAYARLGQPEKSREHVELYRAALKGFETQLKILAGEGGPPKG